MSTDPTGLRASAPAAEAGAAPATGATDAPDGLRRRVRDPDDVRAPGRTRAGLGTGRGRRNRKVRKVHRVVRHVEVWSVAKLGALFVACAYVIAMISGYLLWRAADRVGTIEGVEGFMEDAGGYDNFDILGDVIFRSVAVIGLVLGALTVFVLVLGAVLFNLISDLTGGVRMTVIDEDLVVVPARRPSAEAGTEAAAPPDRSEPDAGGTGAAPGHERPDERESRPGFPASRPDGAPPDDRAAG